MNSPNRAPPSPPGFSLSWIGNIFYAFIALALLFSGNWDLGIPCAAIVAFFFLSDFLKVIKKEKIWPLAQQGDPEAQFELANIYASGYVVEKDDTEALKWYRRAAEQGYAKALDRVSAWYAGGHGTPIDNIEAYFWLLLAKKYGATKTFLNVERMERYLSSEQIVDVKNRVSEWKPSLKQN